jgi:hypothetical protein
MKFWCPVDSFGLNCGETTVNAMLTVPQSFPSFSHPARAGRGHLLHLKKDGRVKPGHDENLE